MSENRYKCHYYNFHLILTLHNNVPIISLYTFIIIHMKISIWLISQIFISLSFHNVITMKVFLDDCPCEDEVIHHFGHFLCLHHQDFAATVITLHIKL
jgi:hypothetical protein